MTGQYLKLTPDQVVDTLRYYTDGGGVGGGGVNLFYYNSIDMLIADYSLRKKKTLTLILYCIDHKLE